MAVSNQSIIVARLQLWNGRVPIMKRTEGLGLGKDAHSTYILLEFESIKELADTAAATPDKYRKSSSTPKGDGLDFHQTETLEDAHHLAVDGWHEARARVDAFMDPLRQKLGNVLETVRHFQYDIVGSEVDIDRYIDGELECMVDEVYREEPREGRVFTLVVDSTLAWHVTADEALRRGAALCALVEAFAMLGYELEVIGEWTLGSQQQNNYTTKYSVTCPFNKAGEPIDIDTMMFALGHSDWFRRIGFALGEGQADIRKRIGFQPGGGYGLANQGSHFYERLGASSVVSIAGMTGVSVDPVKWILEQLDEQGVINMDEVKWS